MNDELGYSMHIASLEAQVATLQQERQAIRAELDAAAFDSGQLEDLSYRCKRLASLYNSYRCDVVSADEKGMAWKDRAERAEQERDAARRLDMFRAGVEAAAKACEDFAVDDTSPEGQMGHATALVISRAVIRPLCTQPMPGATIGEELAAERTAREQAETERDATRDQHSAQVQLRDEITKELSGMVAALREALGSLVDEWQPYRTYVSDATRDLIDAVLADTATAAAEHDARIRREALEPYLQDVALVLAWLRLVIDTGPQNVGTRYADAAIRLDRAAASLPSPAEGGMDVVR